MAIVVPGDWETLEEYLDATQAELEAKRRWQACTHRTPVGAYEAGFGPRRRRSNASPSGGGGMFIIRPGAL